MSVVVVVVSVGTAAPMFVLDSFVEPVVAEFVVCVWRLSIEFGAWEPVIPLVLVLLAPLVDVEPEFPPDPVALPVPAEPDCALTDAANIVTANKQIMFCFLNMIPPVVKLPSKLL